MLEWLTANAAMVLGVLLGISEALALVPGIKSNSIFQLVYNFLKSVVNPAPKV